MSLYFRFSAHLVAAVLLILFLPSRVWSLDAPLSPDGSYAQQRIYYTALDYSGRACTSLARRGSFDGKEYRDIGTRMEECARLYYEARVGETFLARYPNPILKNASAPADYNLNQVVDYSSSGKAYNWRVEVWSAGHGYLGSVSGTPASLACPAHLPVGGSDGSCHCPGYQSKPAGYATARCWPNPDEDGQNNGPEDDDGPCNACNDGRNRGTNVMGGDPIHLVTGNVYHAETDVVFAASGLAFRRYHNSLESPAQRMGNWRADWVTSHKAIRLEHRSDPEGGPFQMATAWVYRPNGKAILFVSRWDSATDRFLEAWKPVSTTSHELMTIQPADSGAWSGMQLHDGSGRYESYNRNLELTHIDDPFGRVVTVTRPVASRVGSVSDRFGNRMDFSYSTTNGLLSTLSVNGQLWATYTYDKKRLSAVTYADGSSRKYLYRSVSNPVGLTDIVDERGVTIHQWEYDDGGRGIRSVLGGNRLSIDIAPFRERFPNGLENGYQFAKISGKYLTTRKSRVHDGLTRAYEVTYDIHGNPVTERDWNGTVTLRSFDAKSREVSRTEAAGTPAQRLVSTSWDGESQRPATIATPESVTAYAYLNGRVATLTRTDRTPWGAGSRTWRFGYTPQGLLSFVDSPRDDIDDTTHYAYDSAGRLVEIVNALGHRKAFGDFTVTGLPRQMVDEHGVMTRFAYDPRGRLTQSALLDATLGNPQTSYAYDAAGNLVQVVSSDGAAVQYEYDAAGQVSAISDPTGARIEYERDAEGNVTRTHVRDASGVLVRRVEQVWDAMRRLVAQSGVNQMHAQYSYDAAGNRLSSTDGLGKSSLQSFDALGRVVAAMDPLGAATRLGYDAADNLASVTDARGLTTTYEYDGLGCLRRLTSPDTGVATFTCDAAGNVVTQTDARGVTTTHGYDALGRRTSTVYNGAPEETAFFGYDATAGGNYGVGRLTAAQNDGADIAFTRDARGHVVSDARTIGGITYTTTYQYDAAGRLVVIGYPTGRTVSYLRNTAGEIVAVTTALPGEPAHTVADGIAWEAFGPVQRLTHGNGVTALRHYDADGHLTQWDVSGLLNRTYVRDAAGRITEIYDADPSRSETYGYDDADRLSGAAGPYGARAWTYDAVGNRLSQDRDGQWSGYTYGGNSNRLYQIAGHEASSLDYDAAGNTLAKSAFAFTYNAANRLRSVRVPGANGPETVTFAYTALGERVLKSGPSGTTHFHYDLAGHLIAESDAAGAAIREYLWLGDTPIALVATRNAGSERELFHVHADHLDTALLLTDSAQQVVWRYARDPFGELVAGAHTVRWPLRFPGQYEDAETGSFYNYFRDYDPQTGRYIESDPIGLSGGINTYAYVGGNPISYTDPIGLYAEMCYRPVQGPIPGQHCFARFDGNDNNTLSFDPRGVGPDPKPSGAICEKVNGPEDDDCVQREMNKCQSYHFIRNNCCHCVEEALKACGQSIPTRKWPNYPINPGPQPGEPGYTR